MQGRASFIDLNPSRSNGSWADKDKPPELCRLSELNLNRLLLPPKEGEQDPLQSCNEDVILHRGSEMAQLTVNAWPDTAGSGTEAEDCWAEPEPADRPVWNGCPNHQ